MQLTHSTTSKKATGTAPDTEAQRLRAALSEEMLRSDCHPSTIVFALLAITVSVLLARYYPPVHAAIGLETWAPVLLVTALATATSALTWRFVLRGEWDRARAVQVPDFVLWGLTPIAVAYSCSQPWGVACALVVHGLMSLHWATICRSSWVLRGSLLATWAPLMFLSPEYGWIAPLGIVTLCLFVIANQASNIRRAEADRREQASVERYEHLRGDYDVLLEQWKRTRAQRDRLAGGERS